MSTCIIAAVKWVPCGKVTGAPDNAAALTREELERIKAEAGGVKDVTDVADSEDAEMAESFGCGVEEGDQTGTTAESAPTARQPRNADDPFDLANYDIEDDDRDNDMDVENGGDFTGKQFFNVLETDLAIAAATGEMRDAESDEEALDIRSSDCVLLAVNAKSDVSTLEVCVYDQDNEAFYVHHDIMLGEMPSCAEFLEYAPKTPEGGGRYCAVGFMNSLIEIWDVNVIDVLEPIATFGSSPTDMMSKFKKKSKNGMSKSSQSDSSGDGQGHTAAIMDLNVNPVRNQLLASGSADNSCRIWDMSVGQSLFCYRHHSAEVQNVRWHPKDHSVLMTCSYDHSIGILDVRTPDKQMSLKLPGRKRLPVSAIWNPQHSWHGIVSSSTGHVSAFDMRLLASGAEQSPFLWDLHGHSKDCVATMCGVSDLLMTASEDKYAKVWKMNGDSHSTLPTMQFERELKAGPLLGVHANPNVPNLFAFAGNEIVLWDLLDTDHVVQTFNLEDPSAS